MHTHMQAFQLEKPSWGHMKYGEKLQCLGMQFVSSVQGETNVPHQEMTKWRRMGVDSS